MKKFLTTKKGMALGVIAALVVAASAYAYFTSTVASGTGTATAGTTAANITATVTNVPNALNPGAGTQPANITLSNDSSTEQARVASYTLAVTDVTKGVDSNNKPISITADCATSNFTAVGGSVDSAKQLLATKGSTGDHVDVTGTVQMNETGLNQDKCQGATVVLTATPVVAPGA